MFDRSERPLVAGPSRILDFRAFLHLGRGRFWSELWRQINDDHCWGMAAELSYYFLLAFFPFLIFLSALIAALALESDLLYRILNELNRFLPGRTLLLVAEIISNFDRWKNSHVLVLWIMLALWSASLGLNGMVGVLNRAYRVRDARSYFRVRALSIVVTVGVSLFVVVAGFLLFFGDDFAVWILQRVPLGEGLLFEAVFFAYTAVRWLLIFIFLNIGIQVVYFALPAKRLPWRLLSPGSIIASLGWLLGTLAFSAYINSFANYQRMYGSLGDLIVLMVWFYYSSLLLLLGGEIDSEVFRLRRSGQLPALAAGDGRISDSGVEAPLES